MCRTLKAECRRIYREAFLDEEADFENRLFENCFECCRFKMQGDRVAAMLFALPCEIRLTNGKTEAYYVYAATTAEDLRGMGFMSGLIGELKKEGKPLFLVPAKKELVRFYGKLGFRCFTATETEKSILSAMPKGVFRELAVSEKKEKRREYTAMYYHTSSLLLDNMYFPYVME